MPIPQRTHYTADEFLAMTQENDQRQELMDGAIYDMASPSTVHQEIVGGLYAAIRAYIRQNHGTCKPFVAPYDVRIDDHNVVIPDVLVVCDPSKIDDKRCNGAPDWVIEVVSSNSRADYIDKLLLYKDAGVREYWIVDPEKEKTFVYFFERSGNAVQFYDFNQVIPVKIYQDAAVQLMINISELI